MREFLLTAAELVVRQFYWRIPFLVRFYHRVRDSHPATRGALLARLSYRARSHALSRGTRLTASGLEEHLREVLPDPHPLIMVHSSSYGIALWQDGEETSSLNSLNPLSSAAAVLDVLTRVAGPGGTVVMPTHPWYADDPGFMHKQSHIVLKYDPLRASSRVGLITELFRRRQGTLRSLHPLSSLAASGPLAEEILKDNLNGDRPLPHGVHSGYYRCCQLDGLVVSLGIPFIRSATVLHVAEEVRDEDWPIKRFFYTRRFIVVCDGEETEFEVRERRHEFIRCEAVEKLRRDWLRAGILHESTVYGIRLDWAKARDILDFMMERNGNGYPYYFPWLAGV